MTGYREQAKADVAEAFGVNERVISARLKVAANCECYIDVHTKYAVAQREARLRLEDALEDSILQLSAHEGDSESVAEFRAALNAVKEG